MSQYPIRRSPVRRRLAATLASTALIAALPATAAHAEGWVDGPAFAASTQTTGIDLASAPDGSATAAWITADGVPSLSVQHATPGGTLGAVRALGEANPDATPVVASGPSGASAVAWDASVGGALELRLALLGADGTPAAPVVVEADLDEEVFDVAVDGDGDATVAWRGDGAVKVRRVAADGTLGPVVVLGSAVGDASPLVTVVPNGVAWVSWNDSVADVQRIARIGADGQLDGAPVPVPAGAPVLSPKLGSSAAGGVLTWTEKLGADERSVAGVRLPLSDAVLGGPFQSKRWTSSSDQSASAPAIGPDGTVTIAWTDIDGRDPSTMTAAASISRFAPGETTAPARQLASLPPDLVAVEPLLAAAPNGALLATWLQMRGAFNTPVFTRRIAADGTFGPVSATGLSSFFFIIAPFGIDKLAFPFAYADGSALLGVIDVSGSGLALSTRILDVTAPQVTTTIPATATAGVPAAFSATASDRAGADLWWDFGDDSGSRRAAVNHVYASPGTYTVTLTATDAVDNETTVRRQVTVAAPAPAPRAAPRRARGARGAAALKLTRIARRGPNVTVAGTISARASGRVTIAYSRRVGRVNVLTKTTAKIVDGRWRTTIGLTGSRAKARGGNATVVASYAGNATTAKASVKRMIAVPKARPKR